MPPPSEGTRPTGPTSHTGTPRAQTWHAGLGAPMCTPCRFCRMCGKGWNVHSCSDSTAHVARTSGRGWGIILQDSEVQPLLPGVLFSCKGAARSRSTPIGSCLGHRAVQWGSGRVSLQPHRLRSELDRLELNPGRFSGKAAAQPLGVDMKHYAIVKALPKISCSVLEMLWRVGERGPPRLHSQQGWVV